jgi:tryptophan synthase alpha chain
MSRIAEKMQALQQQGRRALIPYIAAGDPEPWVTVPLMHALVKHGADILELGVPFSDPMADGPVIQRAAERALKHKISLTHVLAMVHEFRDKDKTTPVVLMGYLNPIEVMGYTRFAKEAAAAGVDGVLTVDLPPEEAHGFQTAMKGQGLDTIFLLAPTSPVERIKLIAKAASGFIYYVSLRGVTGAANLDVREVAAKLKEIRGHTKLPLGVGFGIGSPERRRRWPNRRRGHCRQRRGQAHGGNGGKPDKIRPRSGLHRPPARGDGPDHQTPTSATGVTR